MDTVYLLFYPVENAANCCLQHYLHIDVWDYDTLNPDGFMGRVVVPVTLLSEDKTEGWFPLGRVVAKDNIHGEIYLEMTLKASQVDVIASLYLRVQFLHVNLYTNSFAYTRISIKFV